VDFLTPRSYVCSETVKNYGHFNDKARGGTKEGCPLYDNHEERHESEVQEAAKKVIEKLRAERPDIAEADLEIQVSDEVKRRETERRAKFNRQAPGYQAPVVLNPPQAHMIQRGAPARVRAPRARAPARGAPQAGTPQEGAPQEGAPQTNAPQANAPQTDAPPKNAPQAGIPQASASQVDPPLAAFPRPNPYQPAVSAILHPAQFGQYGHVPARLAAYGQFVPGRFAPYPLPVFAPRPINPPVGHLPVYHILGYPGPQAPGHLFTRHGRLAPSALPIPADARPLPRRITARAPAPAPVPVQIPAAVQARIPVPARAPSPELAHVVHHPVPHPVEGRRSALPIPVSPVPGYPIVRVARPTRARVRTLAGAPVYQPTAAFPPADPNTHTAQN
jgi:hypothetical protein